jgi:hypothetical protein
MLAYVVGVYAVCVWLHLKNVVASFFMVCGFLCGRQLEAELQVIHDLNRTTYEPQQTVLSNNEPTVNHTLDVEPGPSSSNSTLPTQEQPTTTNIDTAAIVE